MKAFKIAILHFNIIEKYPPVMNFIYDQLEENPEVQILVFTTQNTTSYNTPYFPNTKIYRLGKVSANPIVRYISYLYFNLLGSLILLFSKVKFVTAFESLSIFPLWLRMKLNKTTSAHLHFHEYISQPERKASSWYMKYLFKLEDELLKKYTCSQTNEDRKSFFLKDKPYIKPEQVGVRPNLPPKSWWNRYGQFQKLGTDAKIRLVHVGACDNKTMYVKEVLDWAQSNPDTLELTFLSQQLDAETKALILSYKCPTIFIKSPVNYYELPQELIKYDVGLVLYKGHLPNFVFNVPNKVHEYLACGLSLICESKLKSTAALNHPKIYLTNIKSIDTLKVSEFKSRMWVSKVEINS
jgi:hypothetical protein